VDLDQVLVEEAGQSIADIVARFGWQEFRRREKELVARYGKKKGLVLAPGGGAVLDPDNVTALKERGIIIWLTADPDTIQKRLAQDQTTGENRPSLTGADTLREVEKVLKEREPLYQQAAHIIVDTTHQSIDTTTNQILAAVGGLKDG
jgi:shikimate kinase